MKKNIIDKVNGRLEDIHDSETEIVKSSIYSKYLQLN